MMKDDKEPSNANVSWTEQPSEV